MKRKAGGQAFRPGEWTFDGGLNVAGYREPVKFAAASSRPLGCEKTDKKVQVTAEGEDNMREPRNKMYEGKKCVLTNLLG